MTIASRSVVLAPKKAATTCARNAPAGSFGQTGRLSSSAANTHQRSRQGVWEAIGGGWLRVGSRCDCISP